jgi:hypothetical protein
LTTENASWLEGRMMSASKAIDDVRIGVMEVARMLGVSNKTVQYWTDRKNDALPHRRGGPQNERTYSLHDIRVIIRDGRHPILKGKLHGLS